MPAATLRAALAAEGPDAAALRSELRGLLDDPVEALADRELHARLERELRVARRIQQRLVLVTAHQVEGWQTACEYQPAREIGGDFFDVFPMPSTPDQLGIVIADVSGKGISAALLMAFVRPVMRAALDRSGDPAAALERTNTILATERQTGLFVTALATTIDTRTGVVRFASAGHESPLVLSPDAPPRQLGEPAAPLLGAFERLEVAATELRLQPGESLVLYTDGVTDAVDPAGRRFGEERFIETLAAASRQPAEDIRAAVIDAVAAFRGPAEAADDLALLVVQRLAA